mgnify:CR=1 FL=1
MADQAHGTARVRELVAQLRAAEDADRDRRLFEQRSQALPLEIGLPPQPQLLDLTLHLRDELARQERLDEVVGGAGAQAFELRCFAGAGREQQDRNRRGLAILAQRADETDAAETRHHHVGEDEIGPPCLDRFGARPVRRRPRRRSSAGGAGAPGTAACRRDRRRSGCAPIAWHIRQGDPVRDRRRARIVDARGRDRARRRRRRHRSSAALSSMNGAVSPGEEVSGRVRRIRSAGRCAWPFGRWTLKVLP